MNTNFAPKGLPVKLTASERMTLAVLVSEQDERGQCSLSITQLADLTGFSNRSIIRAISSLEEHGIVSVGRHQTPTLGFVSNTYTVLVESLRKSGE